jgi:hypothetical protein
MWSCDFRLKISRFSTHFDGLFDRVISDEHTKKNLTHQYKVVKAGYISDEFDWSHDIRGHYASSGRKFEHELDLAEEIYVGIVDSEVKENGARRSVYPQVVKQVLKDFHSFIQVRTQVDHVSAAIIVVHQCLKSGTVQFLFGLIVPSSKINQE